MRSLLTRWPGRVPYGEALELQKSMVAARRRNEIPDCLLLLEHPPVVTLGRGSDAEHVLVDSAGLSRRGVELHECGRGGDVTYHGPGQLVGYPILALTGERRDAHRYLRDLEECLIRSAAEFDVQAGRVRGLTGVWVDDRKLAAIGVRLSSGWITSHGFALNVCTDLSGFSVIVPCGIAGCSMVNLSELVGRELDVRQVAGTVAGHVAERFGLEPRLPEALAGGVS